jgi:hypothetical protein
LKDGLRGDSEKHLPDRCAAGLGTCRLSGPEPGGISIDGPAVGGGAHGADLDNSGPGHEDDIYETVFVYSTVYAIVPKISWKIMSSGYAANLNKIFHRIIDKNKKGYYH